MNRLIRSSAPLALAAALAIGACGGSSNDKTSSSTKTPSAGSPATTKKDGGTITLLAGTAPDYLDPSEGYTTQSAEATWISYLGLYTYAHKAGTEGGKVIPALAQDFPTVSSDGLTYKLTLRQGMKYSDGSAVKASDFGY